MKTTLSLVAAVCFAGILNAQTTVLSENFDAGIPAGWANLNINGNTGSIGWTADLFGYGEAQHQDESSGQADNILAGPTMDLTGMTDAWAHMVIRTQFVTYMAHVPGSLGNGLTAICVSTDGGATWTIEWIDDIQTVDQGLDLTRDVDLTAYAGQANVQLGIYYSGDYAHEVFLDDVVVDDQAPAPPPPPPAYDLVWSPNLPSSNASLPLSEDFSGGLQAYMATTARDAVTDLPDAEAWCDVSNGELQMGLDPLSTNYHDVRNALVMGISGSSLSSNLLSFSLTDHGEETDLHDGVWVSQDGTNWNAVMTPWAGASDQSNLDLNVVGAGGGVVDLTQDFYLMFAQDDNFPHAYLDGITIDNIEINDGSSAGLVYAVPGGLVAGQQATMQVTGATPGATVMLGYSISGAGPTNTQFGAVDMSLPIKVLTVMTADAQGVATYNPIVPNFPGLTLYTQGVDRSTNTLTNSLVEVLQ